MDRNKLLRECVMLTCFMEHIGFNEKERIVRLINGLNEYSTEQLNSYCEVNTKLKEVRLNSMFEYIN